MCHEDVLHSFEFERFLFDHVIPRDREARVAESRMLEGIAKCQ
jgi:hypothetical protein